MYTKETIAAQFKTRPFDHQLREFEEHAEDDARAKSWTMRTGKSKSTIDRVCHMHLNEPRDGKGRVDGVLIFAPNGVHANWIEREIPLHKWDAVNVLGIAWRSSVAGTKHGLKLGRAARAEWEADREFFWNDLRLSRDSKKLIVFAVPTDSMIRKDVRNAVARFIKTRRRVFLVVDECDDFGTPGSKRTKMIRALARRPNVTPREILSGTMLTGSPLAAFSQFEILKKAALGFDTYEEFKDRYSEYERGRGHGGRSYPKLVGFRNLDELRERIAKFTSVVLREQCGDMPKLEREEIPFEPTPQQRELYEQLRESFLIDLAAGEISVGERAPRFRKMQQVFSGFVIDEFRERHVIPGPNPRIELASREVWKSPGKVILWCEFQADIDFMKAALLERGVSFVEYHGRVTDRQKANNLKTFNDAPIAKVKGFLGHVQAGGRGLDISVASTIIYISHTFKARLRAQSEERATKIGGGNIRVVDIVAPGPDRHILKTTRERINVNDSLTGTGLHALLEGLKI